MINRNLMIEKIYKKFGVMESECCCGQPVLISKGGNTCRKDGKRVFYPGEPDTGWDIFRCKKCGLPVYKSVPGAEYE